MGKKYEDILELFEKIMNGNNNFKIDQYFFIQAALFKYYARTHDYDNAYNALSSLACYDMSDGRIRSHIVALKEDLNV